MKIVRIDAEADDITYGTVEPDGIRLYHGSPFFHWERSETVLPITEVKLLSPVIPTKIIAVGRNYVDHATELGNEIPEIPAIFLKPPTTVIGPMAPIRIPLGVGQVDHEAELLLQFLPIRRLAFVDRVDVEVDDVPRHPRVDGVVGRETALALGIWPDEESLVVRTPVPESGATDLWGVELSPVASAGDDAPPA